ncbi:MAG: hypothetical protein RLP14_08250 [Owenweeksia sp.]
MQEKNSRRGAWFKVLSKDRIAAILHLSDDQNSFTTIAESAEKFEVWVNPDFRKKKKNQNGKLKSKNKFPQRSVINEETIADFFNKKHEISQKALNSFIHFVFDISNEAEQVKRKLEALLQELKPTRVNDKHIKDIHTFIRDNVSWAKTKKSSPIEFPEGWVINIKKYVREDTDGTNEDYKIEQTLFNYVAVLDRFDKPIPKSLIEKLVPEEWKNNEPMILSNEGNTSGIEVFIDNDALHLRLNQEGKDDSESMDFHNALILKILDHCDADVKAEYLLFKNLCLKRLFFLEIFKDFKINIDFLLYFKRFPSPYKDLLLLRLLGIYYGENQQYARMHNYFKECIKLVKKYGNKYGEDTGAGFYMGWASYESQLGHGDEAIEIYKRAIQDFPLPEYENRPARFILTFHYQQARNFEKAIDLWSEQDFFLLRQEDFSDKFLEHLLKLIGTGKYKQARLLQRFFGKLSSWLKDQGQEGLATNLMERLSEKITNNYKLEAAFIRTLFSSSPPKALEKIAKLEANEKVPRYEVASLYMDYHLEKEELDEAIKYGELFVAAGHPGRERMLKNLVIITMNLQPDTALSFCKQLPKEDLRTYYPYALVLWRLDSDKYKNEIFRIFQSYLRDNPEKLNIAAIGQYVSFCIKYNRQKQASKFIIPKLLQINSNENYTHYFISFLYQQQLKLTGNNIHSSLLVSEALKYAGNNERQQATLHSDYGKLLMYSGEGGLVHKTSKFNLGEAIGCFTTSYDLHSYDLVLLNRGICYYHLGKYMLCIADMERIILERLEDQKISYLLKSYYALSDFKAIEDMFTQIKHDKYGYLKGLVYYYLALNEKLERSVRELHFENAIFFNRSYHIKLDQAVFYYDFNRYKSNRLLDNLEKSFGDNKDMQIKIKSAFIAKTETSKVRTPLIKKLLSQLHVLDSENWPFIKGVLNLLGENPLDTRVYSIAFDYYFKFSLYSGCEDILEKLIGQNLINQHTRPLFYKLAENYFDYSQYYSRNKPINKGWQIRCLEEAFRYSEYSLKGTTNIEYAVLHALIPYKQGQQRKHNLIVRGYSNKLRRTEYADFKHLLQQKKEGVKVFLWPVNSDDYYDTLLFYKGKEKAAAAMIGSPYETDKFDAAKMLKTILIDRAFHRKNKSVLRNRIHTRLGHYFYHIDENYEQALKHKRRVYEYKTHDIGFIRAFLKVIEQVKSKNKFHDYQFGKRVSEFYLEHIQVPSIYRHYGNFLKELGDSKAAYKAYYQGWELVKPEPELEFMKCLLNNNIMLLCREAFQKKAFFENPKKLYEIAQSSFESIMSIDKDYRDGDPRVIMHEIKTLYLMCADSEKSN